jgi:hypothetical protein
MAKAQEKIELILAMVDGMNELQIQKMITLILENYELSDENKSAIVAALQAL